MAQPTTSPARQQFIDDEMLRVPMLADQVLDATWAQLHEGLGGLSAHERTMVADLLQHGQSQRPQLVDAFAASVRQQVHAEMAGLRPAGPTLGKPAGGLSLLDEDEIAADVEISRAIEAVKSVCEHELRELATYTAALAGDMDLARDHNPFRAETYARAMWSAAQALSMGRGWQVALMRHAIQPLAQVLRKVYAGSCARLETAGVEPAVYRTLILPGGSRSTHSTQSWRGLPPDLQHIRQTMPARPAAEAEARSRTLPLEQVMHDAERALHALPADAPASVHAQLMESQRERLIQHARSPVDQQLIELLGRLFEAMLSDRRMPRDVRAVLARLQPSVLRVVLRDSAVLDDYDHPVWSFMDHLAHQASLHPEGSSGRDAVLRVGEELVETLSLAREPDIDMYRRATERLAADAQARLQARLARAGADVQAMQVLERRLQDEAFRPSTGMGPLDVTQLDTVPADLLEKLPGPRSDTGTAADWLDAQRPGDWSRLFCRGSWWRVQLLWQSREGEIWLFGPGQGQETLALRRRALERLLAEGLATEYRLRSTLRSAAVELMRRETGAQQAARAG